MKKFLLILSGISVKPYGIETLKTNQVLWKKLIDLYGEENIVELDYNQYLDSFTIQNEFNLKYFDPLRLKLNPFRRNKILKSIENLIETKQNQGYTIDSLCHSQGCWVLALSKAKLNKVIFTGSPIGFENTIGRMIVRQSICPFPWSKPLMSCEIFINLYSDNDFVGHIPSLKEEKWRFGAKETKEIMTGTPHDLDLYSDFILKANLI